MKKLWITRTLPEEVLDAAGAVFDVELRNKTSGASEDEVTLALSQYDAILPTLGDRFTGDAIRAVVNPRTKVLGNFGVGYNHIDVAAARDTGIIVTNTPGTVTDATADIGMTLILMACRRAGECERILRRGEWPGWQPTQYLGTHVTGKTVGIIGMGRIGKAVARRCHAGFGMKVVFFNRSPVVDPGVPARQLDSLHAVLDSCDIAVVTVPASPETHHMIDAEALRAFGPKGILVNIARGDIVDELALIEALETGAIAGAGLDVYENEPVVPDRLRALENAVLLPHLGTAALEVRTAMGMMALENIVAVMEGRAPPNAV